MPVFVSGKCLMHVSRVPQNYANTPQNPAFNLVRKKVRFCLAKKKPSCFQIIHDPFVQKTSLFDSLGSLPSKCVSSRVGFLHSPITEYNSFKSGWCHGELERSIEVMLLFFWTEEHLPAPYHKETTITQVSCVQSLFLLVQRYNARCTTAWNKTGKSNGWILQIQRMTGFFQRRTLPNAILLFFLRSPQCCIVTWTSIKSLEMSVILVNLWIFIVFYLYCRYFLYRSTHKTPILE